MKVCTPYVHARAGAFHENAAQGSQGGTSSLIVVGQKNKASNDDALIKAGFPGPRGTFLLCLSHFDPTAARPT